MLTCIRLSKSALSHLKSIRCFSDLPEHITLQMPALSPTMESGKIQKWNYNIGDEVVVGDVLAEIETDKSTVGFEMIDDGYVAKLLYPEGDEDIPVGQTLAIIVEEKADIEKFANYTAQATQPAQSAPKQEEPVSQPEPTPQPVVAKEPEPVQEENKATTTGGVSLSRDLTGDKLPNTTLGQGNDRVLMSPLAKRLALQNNIDFGVLKGLGTGLNGRVIAENIEAYLASNQPTQTQAQTSAPVQQAQTQATQQPELSQTGSPIQINAVGDLYEDLKLTTMRKVIASRLLESKQTIPHYYLNMDCEMDALMSFRKTLNETSPVKLSVSDLIIKAIALASMDVPEANSHWMGSTIRQYHQVNVNFALSTPAGLLTPVVNDAANLRLSQIATTTKDLINRGREGKLKPEEYSGGTITVSNLGMMGVSNFSAIINPPQSCILAVGKTDRVPRPCEENGVRWVNQMVVTLSCDHRVVDGAVGAQWLQAFKGYIENPMTMLL